MSNYIYQEAYFKSKWFSIFINKWFFNGKKFKIESIVYYSFFFLKKKFNINSFFLFFEILEYLKPNIGIKRISTKSKWKNSTIYPCYLNFTSQYKKSIFWLIQGIQLRKENVFYLKIFEEFVDIIFKKVTIGVKCRMEYYNYAVLFKASRKFKW